MTIKRRSIITFAVIVAATFISMIFIMNDSVFAAVVAPTGSIAAPAISQPVAPSGALVPAIAPRPVVAPKAPSEPFFNQFFNPFLFNEGINPFFFGGFNPFFFGFEE